MKPDKDELVELGVTLIVAVALVLGMGALVIGIGLIVVTWPIWLPLDYVLRKTGHYGFLRFNRDNTFSVVFDRDSFRKK